MSELNKYHIEDEHLVRDKSSSDGAQIKYFMDNQWYKVDYYGGEGEAEFLSSLLLSCTNLSCDKYVKYEKAMINNEMGCVSHDFRKSVDEEFITLYRLYKNVNGRDLATVTSRMDYDDAIKYVIGFVKNQVGLDITNYLVNTFWLDSIILNTDRHFNNYGIIMCEDEYREAPIFDNGKSLFTGLNIDAVNTSMSELVKKTYSKAFSPNYKLNYNFLKEYCNINLDKDKLYNKLEDHENTLQKKVLIHQIEALNK